MTEPGKVRAWITRQEPREAFISTAEELCALGFVQWAAQSYPDKPFHRFSISHPSYDGGEWMLVAEWCEGYDWYPAAFLSGPVDGIPRWVAQYDPFEQARDAEAARLWKVWLTETPEGRAHAERKDEQWRNMSRVMRAGLEKIFAEIYRAG